jgi:integrase
MNMRQWETMNAEPNQTMETAPDNVIGLNIAQRPKKPHHRQRFTVQDFSNATGTKSYRVSGYKRDGARIRDNFPDMNAAKCRQIELETEYLRGHTETNIRATKLSAEQVQLAEVAYIKLGDDWQRILDAVDYWLAHGRQTAVAESPRLDDAFKAFCDWLENGCKLRDLSRKNLRQRVNTFINSVPNMHVADVTPDTIDAFLGERAVSPKTKDNDRRAVSRFFSWCIDRPRRWAAMNPCREVRIEQEEDSAPEILTVKECDALLNMAQTHKDGQLAPYLATCMFAGLRPFEASRLTWQAVNLKDGEIRLEGRQTKTGTPRVITICDTLKAWLTEFEGKPFSPPNWRRDFDVVKRVIGYGRKTKKHPDLKPWPVDVLRHTAISHYFRQTGSYGQTAEQFGNSEAIIKKHYQGRVNSEDTKAFYALLPKKGGRK